MVFNFLPSAVVRITVRQQIISVNIFNMSVQLLPKLNAKIKAFVEKKIIFYNYDTLLPTRPR